MTLDSLLDTKRIIVCVGSGGVGKTTTAAALAVHAAMQGKRALVLTIDPARRLANSLGLAALDDVERRVEHSRFDAAGLKCRGELWAMMLDAKHAFDEMVARHSPSQEVRDRILKNRIYQYISTRLPGSQEYMAMEKLHTLYSDRQERPYDLIVLDTPPTANALDFLDAPTKLQEAIDSAAIRWFLKPFEKGGTFSLKFLGVGSAYVLKTLSRFTGAALLEEIAHFLLEFNALLAGFKSRSAETMALLQSDQVSFVLVSAPEALAIDEAIYFYGKLKQFEMPFGAFVVNRVHPGYAPPAPAPELVALLSRLAGADGVSELAPEQWSHLGVDLVENVREQQVIAHLDHLSITRLRGEAGAADETLVSVPAFDTDIHDLGGLCRLATFLVAS